MGFEAKGKVKPGSTVEFLFPTFDSNDPSASVTTTLAVGDVEVYKDGGSTARASTSGFTVDNDFASVTGIHRVSIDLSDNTTANFYEAGSSYIVAIDTITVDSGSISFPIGAFIIGYEGAILDTTIATLSSQTSFTLEDGPADNDALNGCPVLVHDLASAIQIAIGYCSDYVGSTKTVTLAADPGIFTMAAGDNISFFMPSQVGSWNNVPLATTNPLPNAAADAAGGLPISDAGGLDLDAMNTSVGNIETDTNSLNDTKIPDTISLANINAEVDTALDTAIPGSPTSNSINERVKTLDDHDLVTKIPDTLSLANINSEVDTAFTTQMADSTVADGTIPTREQAILAITRFLMERAISSTTMTVYKEDGTTSVMTFTLDDASDPTSITRAS